MKRKDFIRSVGALVAGSALIPSFTDREATAEPLPPPFPPTDPDDERFWGFVRDQFPLGRERAYFNTGGLGPSPYAVIDAVKGKMDELEVISETGHDEKLWRTIKTTAGEFLGCDADELAFTRNTTEGVNIVAGGLPFKWGDEIITTTHEHVGNALAWLALEKRAGITVRFFEPSTVSQQENLDRIQNLITKKTRLISVPHAVTTTGLILPIKEIAVLASGKDIWFFVDGAQTAGMFPFNLHDLGCDAYATSGHKWLLGPKETGLLYVKRAMLDVIEAKAVGAYSASSFDFQKARLTFEPSAQRYEYGTVSIPLRVGLGAAFGFIQRIGIENVWKRDRMLSNRVMKGLQGIPKIQVLSPENDAMRSAMITFMHEEIPYLDLQRHLDTFNLRTRAVSEGGLAALRISTHFYNSTEEIDRLLEAVRSAKKED